MLRAVICIIVLTFLAACQLESDQPLIDASQGERIISERFTILAVDEDGAFNHEKSGKVSTTEMRYRNGSFELPPTVTNDRFSISFHPTQGIPGFYIAQFVPEKENAGAIYLAVRVTSDALYFRSIKLDKTTLAALKGSGVDVEKSGSSHKVSSRNQLDEVVRLWVQINLRELEKLESFDGKFLIEEGSGSGLRARADAAECLALAGHPEDPSVKKLSKKWKKGVPLDKIDPAVALPICQRAARQAGTASVRYSLARAYEAKGNYVQAERLLPPLMSEDFSLAYVLSAEHRAKGNGVTKDTRLARKILEEPASRGQVMPAYLLGIYELQGTLGTPNSQAAQRWLDVAAKGGMSEAQYQLGLLLANNQSKINEAYKNFRQAADQDHVQARYRAGRALYFGMGIETDKTKAYNDLLFAANKDVPWAQYFVGFMLARGQGIKKNEKSAVTWLRKAHSGKVLPATGELGHMIYQGAGTATNKAEGRKLLEQASKAGDKNATQYLASIKARSQPKASTRKYDAPKERAQDVDRLANGKPFTLTEQNLPFMTGVASELLERCKAPSNDIGLKTELALFVSSSSFGSILGFDYSNPNLGESLGSMGRSQASMVSGVIFARQLPCGAVANRFAGGIAKALRSNAQGSNGGASNFVKSCTPHFDQRRCSCLANIGRQAIPNLHRRHYERQLIKEIINRNPFLGIQIGLACQIGNY